MGASLNKIGSIFLHWYHQKIWFPSLIISYICCALTVDLTIVNILFVFGKFGGFSTSIPFTTFLLIKYLRSLILLDCITAFSSCSFITQRTSSSVLCMGLDFFYVVHSFEFVKVLFLLIRFLRGADGSLGREWVKSIGRSRLFLCWRFGNGSLLESFLFGRGRG